MSGKTTLPPDLEARLQAVLSDLHTFVREQRDLNTTRGRTAPETRWLDYVESAIFKFWDLKIVFVRR